MRRRLAAAIVAPAAGRALVEEVCATSCERVALVLGGLPQSTARAVAGLPVALVPNPAWCEGEAAALRCALAWALRSGADGLLLVDEAPAARSHLEALLAAFRATGVPAASGRLGAPGLPAVFGVEAFARLAGSPTPRRSSMFCPVLPRVTV